MKTAEGRAKLAISIAAVAVFAWGFGPLLVRGVDASAPTIVFWRLWLAMPVMLSAAYFTGGRVSLALLRSVFVPGVLFGISTLVGFTSYQTTSIANATLIGALQPVLMLFIGPLLFHDRSSARQILLAVIALGGISTVVLGANQSSGATLHGDVLALINLGLFTTYFVRMKQVRNKGIHSIALIAGVFSVAA
ncbi:MAG TPA: EamA family transporter, partial [Ilumatobacteraceae bacterium]